MAVRRSRIELVRYSLLSLASALISLGLPVLLHERLGADPRLGVAIGFAVVFVFNFVLLRRYVFRHRGSASASLGRFAATSLVFRGAEYLAFLLLYQAGVLYWIAQAIVIGVSFVVKFVAMRHIVFRPSRAEPQS